MSIGKSLWVMELLAKSLQDVLSQDTDILSMAILPSRAEYQKNYPSKIVGDEVVGKKLTRCPFSRHIHSEYGNPSIKSWMPKKLIHPIIVSILKSMENECVNRKITLGDGAVGQKLTRCPFPRHRHFEYGNPSIRSWIPKNLSIQILNLFLRASKMCQSENHSWWWSCWSKAYKMSFPKTQTF